MSCVSCGSGFPSRYSLEYSRRFKPENTKGCSCSGGNDNLCTTPSIVNEETPLGKWEKIHGKVITIVTFVKNEFGETIQFVEKKACPKKNNEKLSKECCSFRYKI